MVWARREEVAVEINTRHTNSRYLRETQLPVNITSSSDPREVLAGADLVVLAVPAQSLREQLRSFRDAIEPDAVLISLMKGLERDSDARMSEVISAEIDIEPERIAVLSGPNLAMEIARKQPTASVVACSDIETAAWIASLCSTEYFRPYTNTDIIGVEIGGIAKNVIALAVGICDGMGMGDNTKSSIITRGLAETTRLALGIGRKIRNPVGTCRAWATWLPPAHLRSRATTPRDACWDKGCTSMRSTTGCPKPPRASNRVVPCWTWPLATMSRFPSPRPWSWSLKAP